MGLTHDILDLAATTETTSLSTAFATLDAPIPDIFLTIRELERHGALERVGPGNYRLTEDGHQRLAEREFHWPGTKPTPPADIDGEPVDGEAPDDTEHPPATSTGSPPEDSVDDADNEADENEDEDGFEWLTKHE